MLKRRSFLASLALSASGLFMESSRSESHPSTHWLMPDESHPHTRTWMAFGVDPTIWGRDIYRAVEQNITDLALTIAEYEPVSVLVKPNTMARARKLLGHDVELIPSALDDIWIRDTGPVFVKDQQGHLGAVDFNFNGWGNKQRHASDAKVASTITNLSNAHSIVSKLTLEGGGIEVDGEGTAIITESCTLNGNRNPGLTKTACEHELKKNLGIRKVIWLPGIRGMDITDGHTDFYARFTQPGQVVAALDPDPDSFDHKVTLEHLRILKTSEDSQGRRLRVTTMRAPAEVRPEYASEDFAAGYINFYVCNGAVIAPEFGDQSADDDARQKLIDAYPGREVIQVNIDGIAAGGGGIHCVTQQEPA